MAFTEDFAVFFDQDDFATSATINFQSGASREISVIFDAVTQGATLYEAAIEANTPNLQCQSSDLIGVKTKKDTIIITGKSYIIERIEPDGTGVSTVYLK